MCIRFQAVSLTMLRIYIYIFIYLFYDHLFGYTYERYCFTFQIRCFYSVINSRCFLLGYVMYLVS
jgi:hypothetical protein